MAKRRWECVKEAQKSNPNFIQEFERIRKAKNHEWLDQLERMKNFVPEENHTYSITYTLLCVPNAKTHEDIPIDKIQYNQEKDEYIVTTSKHGEKILISLEIIALNDKYFEPESADDIAASVFWS